MLFTVTVHVAVFLFDVVTVIVAVPGPTAVTDPLEDTLATPVLLEDQASVLSSVV